MYTDSELCVHAISIVSVQHSLRLNFRNSGTLLADHSLS